MIEQLEIPQQESKYLKALLNGVKTQQSVELKVLDNITMQKLRRLLTRAYQGIPMSVLRIFSEIGCELFDEDLPFLSNGQVFFVSPQGEDFYPGNIMLIYDVLHCISLTPHSKVQLCQHKFTKKLVTFKHVGQYKYTNTEEIESAQHQDELQRFTKNPRLVDIYHIYQIDRSENVYIMEFMMGGNLKTYLNNKGILSEDEARNLFLQMVSALQFCHSRRLLHRNLKLENILFSDLNPENLKLVDVGIDGQNFLKLKQSSFQYLAPELLNRKRPNFSAQSDVWALGVILYYMIFNQYPFEGYSLEEIEELIIRAEYTFPQQQIISNQLKDLFARIFEVDPLIRINIVDILQHPWCNGISEIVNIEQHIQPKLGKINKFSILRRSTTSQCLAIPRQSTSLEQFTARKSKHDIQSQLNSPKERTRITSIDKGIAITNTGRDSIFKKSENHLSQYVRNRGNFSSQHSLSTKVQQSQLSGFSITHSLTDLLNKDFNKVLQKFPSSRGINKGHIKRLSDGQIPNLPQIQRTNQKQKSQFFKSIHFIQSPKSMLNDCDSNLNSHRVSTQSQVFSQALKINTSKANQVKTGFYKRFTSKLPKDDGLRSQSTGQKQYIQHI